MMRLNVAEMPAVPIVRPVCMYSHLYVFMCVCVSCTFLNWFLMMRLNVAEMPAVPIVRPACIYMCAYACMYVCMYVCM